MQGKDPGFGYGVLAQLISHEKCGRHCNVILTTNFDGLVADALYLYTNQKPLVVAHESLIGFVTISRAQPVVIKLHGDAQLAPKNIPSETEKLDKAVEEVIIKLLSETGLIFIGYGGNDKSIVHILNQLPREALSWGVYWIGRKLPEDGMKDWLESRDAVWVKLSDFDRLMLHILDEFDLDHPKRDRFDELFKTYFDTFDSLRKKLESKAGAAEKKVMEKAQQKLIGVDSWWSVILEANMHRKTDLDKADRIYQDGLKKFPDRAELFGSYAAFLHETRKDHDKAEEYYKKALEANPNDADDLGNYALFLQGIRKEYDKAEEYYKKALEADPNHVNNLSNYASFLKTVHKEHDKAEEYYKKALEADPNHADILGNYAVFLKDVRKDHDKAEEYYKKALEADPNNANNLANYAGFLLADGRYEKGFELLEKSLKLASDTQQDLKLECCFYRYAHVKDEETKKQALIQMKELIQSGIRSPGWNLTRNVERAIEDGHPHAEFLDKLSRVISKELSAEVLEEFDIWKDTQ